MKTKPIFNIFLILFAVCTIFTSCSDKMNSNSTLNGEWQSYHYDETDFIGCSDETLIVTIKGNQVKFDFGYDTSMCDPGIFTTTFDKETLQCEKIVVYIGGEREELSPSLRFIDKERNMLWVTFLSLDGYKSVYQCVRKLEQPGGDEQDHSPEMVLEYSADFNTTKEVSIYCTSRDVVEMTLVLPSESYKKLRAEGYSLLEIYQNKCIKASQQVDPLTFPSTPEQGRFEMNMKEYFFQFSSRNGGRTILWFNVDGENESWTNGTGGLKIIRK